VTDKILGFLRAQQGRMVSLLTELAALESPTDDPRATARVLDRLAEELAQTSLTVRWLRGRASAGLLVAHPVARVRRKPLQLLVGHCDTVWPVGTDREMPVQVVEDQIRGPGVFDMKGGLVQMIFALRALREVQCDPPVTPVVIINSDEETGSADSRRITVRLARRAARAFVLEPAYGTSGKLKTSRKAVGEFEVVVRGRAAHAGLSPGEGTSAVLELSHQIQRLFAMNDPSHGISVNVGTIDGGVGPNVVAPEVRARVDVRVRTLADAARVESAIRALTPVDQKSSIHISGSFGHPPLEPLPRNRALWELARSLGQRIGIDLEEAAVGGASDGNTISQYTATLDGLGAVGDGAHAAHEYVLASKLSERAALVALLLAAPLRADEVRP
jgi:glutamate carboxypeptidase